MGYYYFGFAKTIKEINYEDGIDGLFIAYGDGNREVLHAVIINSDGDLIHDPHPSKEGINDIKGIFMIKKIEY